MPMCVIPPRVPVVPWTTTCIVPLLMQVNTQVLMSFSVVVKGCVNFHEMTSVHKRDWIICHTNEIVQSCFSDGFLNCPINNTLAARGLEEPCASFPDFCDNCQFHVIYSTVFPLVYVLYFKEFLIHDSRGFMILKNNWLNLLGLCYFPLNT